MGCKEAGAVPNPSWWQKASSVVQGQQQQHSPSTGSSSAGSRRYGAALGGGSGDIFLGKICVLIVALVLDAQTSDLIFYPSSNGRGPT